MKKIGFRKQHILNCGLNPTSMDELGHCIINLISNFGGMDIYGQIFQPVKCLGLAWDVTHSDSVSNSHSAPEGFPQNWGTKPNLPKGYPGWNGRVWVRYNEQVRFGSDPFSYTLTHTGTGGGGSYDGPWTNIDKWRWRVHGCDEKNPKFFPKVRCYSWDYKIFDADWPNLEEISSWKKAFKKWQHTDLKRHNEKAMLAKLEGHWIPDIPRFPQPTHKFLWEDPIQVQLDQEFMEANKNVNLDNDTRF